MTFKIFISSAIVSAIIAAIGNVITTRMAQKSAEKTAQETANKEIEKLKIELEHRDKIRAEEAARELDEEFAQMIASVNNYIFMTHLDAQTTAASKVSAFMRHNLPFMEATLAELLEAIDRTPNQTQYLQTTLRPLLYKLNTLKELQNDT